MEKQEKNALEEVFERESLAEKKIAIYARLLTDSGVVQALEEIKKGHEKRRATLATFLEIEAPVSEMKGGNGNA
ncbi:MAG: hypothetical protein IJX81_04910 [Clostridia bacterium]|nr:hypothetical protein [Clostridia bacterium]